MKQVLLFAVAVVIVALVLSPSTMTQAELTEQLVETYPQSLVEFVEGGEDAQGGYKLYRITDPEGTAVLLRVDITYKTRGAKLGPDFKVNKFRVVE